MGTFLGCVSKQKIDNGFFQECLNTVHKESSKNVRYYESFHGNLHILLGEMTNEPIHLSNIPKKTNSVCVVSDGITYSTNVKDIILPTRNTSQQINEAYSRFGNQLVNHIEGKYSCAIYDKSKGEISLMRDSFCSKSLYYYHDSKNFIFSSDIKTIVHFLNRCGGVTVDKESVVKYFCFCFIPSPSTLFSKIKKLDAANLLHFNIHKWHKSKTTRFWDIENVELDTKLTEPEIIEKTEFLLKSSVESYYKLTNSQKSSVMLGGLDSTAVAIFLSQICPQTTGYTIRYPGVKDNRDIRYATQASKKLGITHYSLYLNSDNILENFSEAIKYTNEPTCQTGVLPYYFMAKNINNKTPYVFYGNGAELLFDTSYFPTYSQLKRIKQLNYLSLGLVSKRSNNLYNLLKNPILEDYVSQFLFLMSIGVSKEISKTLKVGCRNTYRKTFIDEAKIIKRFRQKDVLNQMLYFGYHHKRSNFFIPGGDGAVSAAGIEVITPYANRELVEFMFSVQGKWKINQISNKYILKKIVSNYLGDDIAYRKSNTLVEYPYGKWISKELKDIFEHYLFIENEYINTNYVRQIFSDHIHKRSNNFNLLNQIFQLQYHINSYKKW